MSPPNQHHVRSTEVDVEAPCAHAFSVFAEGIDTWWGRIAPERG